MGSIHWGTDITGYYQFKTNADADLGYTFYKKGSSYLNTGSTASAYVTKVSGTTGYGGFGILFGWVDSSNYMIFEISSNKYYRVLQLLSGTWYTLIDWAYSANIYSTGYENILYDYYKDWGSSYSYRYYHYLYINDTSSNVCYIRSTGTMTGYTGIELTISSSNESFPDTPVDIQFKKSASSTMPSIIDSGEPGMTLMTIPTVVSPAASELSGVLAPDDVGIGATAIGG